MSTDCTRQSQIPFNIIQCARALICSIYTAFEFNGLIRIKSLIHIHIHRKRVALFFQYCSGNSKGKLNAAFLLTKIPTNTSAKKEQMDAHLDLAESN